MERKLLVSRIKTPDGTILTSEHVHDYKTHFDKNGELYMLDGGREYQRTSLNNEPFEDVSIYSDSPYEEIRQYVKRGTFTKDGYRIWVPLCKLSNDHLKNILTYNEERNIGKNWFSDLVEKEIEYRKENNIEILEYDYAELLPPKEIENELKQDNTIDNEQVQTNKPKTLPQDVRIVFNNAREKKPNHLQRCLCYNKYMNGYYCYVYDDISKYWCTQTTVEHDPDGENHISDYADFDITMWAYLD